MDTSTRQLLSHLWRGGTWAYYWQSSEAKDERNQPRLKRTLWNRITTIPDLPPERSTAGALHTYFGIHPVAKIPSVRTNRNGETYTPRASSVRPVVAEISVINCLFAEFDIKSHANAAACLDVITSIPQQPSVVIASGGGFHCYWLLVAPYHLDTDERRTRVIDAQADWVTRIGAERESKDLARVLRLPGTHNYKSAYAPDYPTVTLLEADFTRLYALNDLVGKRAPRSFTVPSWAASNTDTETARIERALQRLSLWRCDDYAAWVGVGMALRSLGNEGLRLWEQWSQRSPKYRPGECAWKWNSINREDRGLGIGSLFAWAKQDDPGGEPRTVRPFARAVHPLPPPPAMPVAPVPADAPAAPRSIDAARSAMRAAIDTYLAQDYPDHILVIAAPPGLGKTRIAVEVAEEQAAHRQRRTIYCAPRTDFWIDVIGESHAINAGTGVNPLDLWYEWRGRDAEQDTGHTMCDYADAMRTWLHRGHPAMAMCSAPICGWHRVSGTQACAYHAQKATKKPIIFAQHAHAVLGHPLMETASLVIGDENPMAAFARPWHIPREHLVPRGIDPSDPLVTLLTTMHHISQRMSVEGGTTRSGSALITDLGGPQTVLAAVSNPAYLDDTPTVFQPTDVLQADYAHLSVLCGLLRVEAEAALEGRACIARVILDRDGLTLLRGMQPSDLPPHVIWLDATATQRVYDALFAPRKVIIIRPDVAFSGTIRVVTDSSYSKSRLYDRADDGSVALAIDKRHKRRTNEEITRVEQIQSVIKHLITTKNYTKPAFISYKDLTDTMFSGDFAGGWQHFGGSRGSNALKDCDALFVVGTPQPAPEDVIRLASMVYRTRLAPFDSAWQEQDRPYHGITDANGNALGYAVSGFWRDEDLAALHWQVCEAELIQAIHRARPLTRSVDVWLFTPRPLDGVPVTTLTTIAELLGTPEGVDPWTWNCVWRWAAARYEATAHGAIAFDNRDLVREFRLSPASAGRYLSALIAALPDAMEARAVVRGAGRPPRAVQRH